MKDHFICDDLIDVIQSLKDFPALNYTDSNLYKIDSSNLMVFKLALLYCSNIRVIDLDPIEFIDYDDFVRMLKLTMKWSEKQKWMNKLVFIAMKTKVLMTTRKKWHLGRLCITFNRTYDINGVSSLSPETHNSLIKPLTFDYCKDPYRYELYIGYLSPTAIIHTFYAQKNVSKIIVFLENIRKVIEEVLGTNNFQMGMFESIQIEENSRRRWVVQEKYGDDWVVGECVIDLDKKLSGTYAVRMREHQRNGINIFPVITTVRYLKR